MPAVASDAPGDAEQRAKSSTSKQAMDTFSTFRKTAAFRAHRRQIKLGPYLLLQTLGEGEFGKVKLAVHTQTGQEVRRGENKKSLHWRGLLHLGIYSLTTVVMELCIRCCNAVCHQADSKRSGRLLGFSFEQGRT